MKKYHRFHLTDIPTDKFCVLLKGNLQKKLIELASDKISRRKIGKFKDLAIHLQRKCKSFSNVKIESLCDRYISLWKKRKMFVPIDCVLELCRITSTDINQIEDSIEKIKYRLSPNKTAVAFPFLYDENVAAISEAIKTEGHLKRDFGQCRLSSQDTKLINHFKRLLNKVGVPNLYENLVVMSDVPNRNIKYVLGGKKNFKFSVRERKNKIKIRFVDNFTYGGKKVYKIVFNDGSMIKINIRIPFKSKILIKSSFGLCSSLVDLHIANMTFCKLMNILCDVPVGKKSEIIQFSELIFNSPKSVQKSVISTIMACEGWVEIRTRRIRFFVKSEKYLLQLKRLFEILGLCPTMDNRGYISITSNHDLTKFSKEFDLIIEDKNNKLRKILNTYEQFPFRHGEGLINTLKILHDSDKLDAYIIAKKLKKHKDTAFFHLNKGIKNGFICKNTDTSPYNYSITEKGKSFLGENDVMPRD